MWHFRSWVFLVQIFLFSYFVFGTMRRKFSVFFFGCFVMTFMQLNETLCAHTHTEQVQALRSFWSCCPLLFYYFILDKWKMNVVIDRVCFWWTLFSCLRDFTRAIDRHDRCHDWFIINKAWCKYIKYQKPHPNQYLYAILDGFSNPIKWRLWGSRVFYQIICSLFTDYGHFNCTWYCCDDGNGNVLI